MVKRNRKKRLRPAKQTRVQRKIGCIPILYLITLSFIIASLISNEIRDYQLANYGIVHKGYVYKHYHKKGTNKIKCRFYYPNTDYERIGIYYDNKKMPGDSIDIIFLPNKPSTSRPWDRIKTRKKARERIERGELPK